MQLIAGKLNTTYLESVIRKHVNDCSEVIAVVAYCDSIRLFEICKQAGKRVRFYGRLDAGIPVAISVLNWFHNQCNPNYTCYLLRGGLHAKIIWLKGEGVYIGSANLTDNGWMSNIEAGVFITETQLGCNGLLTELATLIEAVHERSIALSSEILTFITELEKKRSDLRNSEQSLLAWFKKNCKVPEVSTVISVDVPKADELRKSDFLREWNSTLQLLRNIAVRLRTYRPAWIDNSVPDGVHVDQFLHAYYYLRIREGNKQPFDEHFERNHHNPEGALIEQMTWWQTGKYPHQNESLFVHEWAPSSKALLAKNRIGTLTEVEFTQLCKHVHAIRDHAIKMESIFLDLQEGPHEAETKIEAFGKWLYMQRSVQQKTVLDTIEFVLYGGNEVDLPERLWNATRNVQWKINHLGLSSLGEIVGWALPDIFPPRNSRTSKALRALGNYVEIY